MMSFSGFEQESIDFLKNLSVNNNKDWFDNNKMVYDRSLFVPLKQLSADLALPLSAIDKEIETSPSVNKTVSRIYRDIRFSNDKSPFRTDQWLSFKRPKKSWGNVPEFYFYFTPDEYQFGMGYYAPTSDNMRCFRNHIERYPDRFLEIINKLNLQNTLALVGSDYRRPIPNELPDQIQKWYRKKGLAVCCTRKMDKVFLNRNLGLLLEEAFITTSQLYLFIIESINQ